MNGDATRTWMLIGQDGWHEDEKKGTVFVTKIYDSLCGDYPCLYNGHRKSKVRNTIALQTERKLR